MKTYDRNNKSGGGRSFGGNRDRGERDFGGSSERRSTVLHRATCAQCGSSCEVPFRPTGERPVLCNNCFRRDDAPDHRSARFEEPRRFSSETRESRPSSFDSERGGNSSFKAPDQQTQKQLAAINVKLDKILQILGEGDEGDDDGDIDE